MRVTALGAAVAALGSLQAQAPLPATAPTSVTPSQLPSANPPVSRGTAPIHWDGHLLQISGTGESLRGVLRDIADRTGVHITGTPPDDRIYGTYGPAPLVDVLSDLVSGLAVNMLFVERTGSRPAELTFTARNGSASPSSSPQPQGYAQQQPPSESPIGPPQPPPNTAANTPGPGDAGGAAAGTPPTDASGSPGSPNGVKTPQEIFEQLQRLRARATTAPQQ